MAINYRLCQKGPEQHKNEIPYKFSFFFAALTMLRGFSAWRKRKLVKKNKNDP